MTGGAIGSLLIANRGEVACRIIQTCRDLDIRSVAVHSSWDQDARHVRLADEAVKIESDRPANAYLDIEQLVEAARAQNCDAVHPGYGFLSENAEFARHVSAAGVRFVGPSPDTIRLMGDKVSAREAARRAGVEVVPGTSQPVTQATLVSQPEILADVPFPVMVKAAGGGGGIGMVQADDNAALDEALARASGLGDRIFGDPRVYVEHLLPSPRHVEVQVFGDGRGQVLILGDRDCSLQRRQQKVIEEAPAPSLSSTLRGELHRAAADLTEYLGYAGAGTIEFLVQDSDVFFLEMNTRLQVEHPVTELVEGIDLVAWQLGLAAGDVIPWSTRGPRPGGHAIECRIYAERPESFIPSPGRITRIDWPTDPWVRVDAGYDEGDEVTTAFDPLVAKLVVAAEDRESARERMIDALSRTEIAGITTNIPSLRKAVGSVEFTEARLTTTTFEQLSVGSS